MTLARHRIIRNVPELNLQVTVDVSVMSATSAQFTEPALKLGFRLMYQGNPSNNEVRETVLTKGKVDQVMRIRTSSFYFMCCCDQNKYFSQLIFIATQTHPSQRAGWKENLQVGLIPF